MCYSNLLKFTIKLLAAITYLRTLFCFLTASSDFAVQGTWMAAEGLTFKKFSLLGNSSYSFSNHLMTMQYYSMKSHEIFMKPSGFGSNWIEWFQIIKMLSKFLRICLKKGQFPKNLRKNEWFLISLRKIEWFLGTTGTIPNEATAVCTKYANISS